MKKFINKTKNIKKGYLISGSIITLVIVLNLIIALTTGNNVLDHISTSVLNNFGIYTEEIKDINLKSDGYENNEPGSFKVEKSAKWTGENKARITFDIDTVIKEYGNKKDIILVLDVSSSMIGQKIDKVKKDTTELVDYVLTNKNNNIALVTFDTSSTIVNEFTNNKDKISNSIQKLEPQEATNYYSALKNVGKILENYKQKQNTDLVILFLTDGYPNEQTPNETAEYKLLKEKYPYIHINAIQYEMGNDIKEEIKVISDNQFVSNINTLNNILLKATLNPVFYNTFELTDYIDNEYFYIEKQEDIKVPFGKVNLAEENGNQKVKWNVDKNEFKTGDNVQITIDIKVQNNKLDSEGYFTTNKKASIKVQANDFNESRNITKTPVLKAGYKVIYDANAPKDCKVEEPETKTSHPYQKIKVTNTELKCKGYTFKGWEIKTKNIKKINDNTFTMPHSDVEIKGKWTKVSLNKSMQGTISEVQRLYNVIENQAVLDNTKSEFVSSPAGIDFSQNASDTNGKGVYTFSSTKDDKYPVHYYRGPRGKIENNNLKFAGFCWKIVRTTETGGTKLVYNGAPDSNGKCTNKISRIESPKLDKKNSPAYDGYMYGSVYTGNDPRSAKLNKDFDGLHEWYKLGSTTDLSKIDYISKDLYYSTSVEYIDGKYILKKAEKKVYKDNYSNLKGYYTCLSENETSCSNVYYIESAYLRGVRYVEMTDGNTYDSIYEKAKNNPIIFGNDVVYNNGKYTLINTIESSSWSEDKDKIGAANGYRYTCYSNTSTCEEVYYFYQVDLTKPNYIGDEDAVTSYITLNNGIKASQALDEMTTKSTNENDSDNKKVIDKWYKENLLDYTSKLEDTVWCNDRRVYDKGGFDNLSSNILYYEDNNTVIYNSYMRNSNPSLKCENANDRFTVNSNNGNGKLTYPIALITRDEASLIRDNFSSYEKMTPYMFSSSYFSSSVSSRGYLAPSISLIYDTFVYNGDGTETNPYEIDMFVYKVDIENNTNIKASQNIAQPGSTITLSSIEEQDKVSSFKMNGTLVEGNSFTMPEENVTITDVETNRAYNINNTDSKIKVNSYAFENQEIKLTAKSKDSKIISFKMNDTKIYGDTFTMPQQDVTITNVVLAIGSEEDIKKETISSKIESTSDNKKTCKVLNTSGNILGAGCYYLDSDYYYDKQISSNLSSEEEIYIDLNGHSITYGGWANWDPVNYQGSNNAAIYGTNGNIYIYDSTKKNTVSLDFTLVEGYDEVTVKNIDYQASVWRPLLKSDGNINIIDSNIVDKNMCGVESIISKDLLMSNAMLNINRTITNGKTTIKDSTVHFNSKNASAIWYNGGDNNLTITNSTITGKGPVFYVRHNQYSGNSKADINIENSTLTLTESTETSSDASSFVGTKANIKDSNLTIFSTQLNGDISISNSTIDSLSPKTPLFNTGHEINIVYGSKISTKANQIIRYAQKVNIDSSELEALKGQIYSQDNDNIMIRAVDSNDNFAINASNSKFTSKGGIFESNKGIIIDNCEINTETKNVAITSCGVQNNNVCPYKVGDVIIRYSTINGENSKNSSSNFIASGKDMLIENSLITASTLYSYNNLTINKESTLTLESQNLANLYIEGKINIKDSNLYQKINSNSNFIYSNTSDINISDSSIVSTNITNSNANSFAVKANRGNLTFNNVNYKGSELQIPNGTFNIKDSNLDIHTSSDHAINNSGGSTSGTIKKSQINFSSNNIDTYLYLNYNKKELILDNSTVNTDTNVVFADPIYLKGKTSLKSKGDYQIYLRNSYGYLTLAKNFSTDSPIKVFNESLENNPKLVFAKLESGVTDKNIETIVKSIKNPYHDNWTAKLNITKTGLSWESSNCRKYTTSMLPDTVFYYADSATYSNGQYTLNNPKPYTWQDNYQSLVGKYTSMTSPTGSWSTIPYVTSTNNNTLEYIIMTYGEVCQE